VTHRSVEKEIGGKLLKIETGKIARQAGGSALVTYADTVVLVSATRGPAREGINFFPLTVEYQEKTYAAGKFPGGFYKREGRPTTKEIITMRLIDRPTRPLFPDNYKDEVQIMGVVLSADKENDPDVLAMIGSSAALGLSDIPFLGPTGSVRVGYVDGEFVLNPTHSQRESSKLDLVVSGTKDAIMMVEAGAKEVSEETVLSAIFFGHKHIREIIEMIEDLVSTNGKEKIAVPENGVDAELYEKIKAACYDEIVRCNFIEGKHNRDAALKENSEKMTEQFASEDDKEGPTEKDVLAVCDQIEKEVVREFIVKEERRSDGRSLKDIRPISIDIGMMPRTHGSAVFTRGETQALVAVTLGTPADEQRIDGLTEEEESKKFMLHYNFPPFCVGEVRPVRGPGRREIGHGALAERALEVVIPEDFPYTIRIVSDILESNGSSSMASVCGGTLAMMDAGIPIKDPVAGIAMGLVKEGEKVKILSDILGVEDHFGDMDFKVTGTQHGITALQMDMKISGIDKEIMKEALEQAREGRIEILRAMLKAIPRPRANLSKYAPRLVKITIDQEKIGTVIGPGGKMIRKIQEDTGAEIEIDDDGVVTISASNDESVDKAKETIEGLTAEAKVGEIYEGKVTSVRDFGAFVEILPGTEGLLHISELSEEFVKDIHSAVKMGEMVKVKVVSIDDTGRIRLSKKAVSR